jgi:hypothetical protein
MDQGMWRLVGLISDKGVFVVRDGPAKKRTSQLRNTLILAIHL